MVNVGSSHNGVQSIFDLETQAGVMHVLASLRSSDLHTTEKNELRDLIFLYTNGGKDQTVRRALEQKIAQHNLQPAVRKRPETPLPPPPTIGKYRAAPAFVVPPAPQPVVVDKKPTFTADPVWVREKPVVEEVPVIEEPVAPVSAEPAPVATTIPVQSTATASFGDNEAYLLRIREIKALVNEKVGNPVNLVDINNEVGREYMAALLDAMKKINSGTSAASAMKRLEDSYKVVEEALRNHSAGSTSSHAESVQTVMPVYEPPASAADVPEPESDPVVVEEELHQPEPEVVAPPRTPVTIAHVSSKVTPVTQVAPLGEAAPPPPPPPASQQPYFASLAEYGEKPNAAPATTSLKATATAGDPLFDREVDEGLQQLLSEWTLFKKSGLFGTGPKGKEHPLFKKMAPLQIPLLLAGRFDGATQEIKQSVTDYMNGWRYEQGLIYQQNETFEHYLRRVIRHIIDLQKGK